MAYALYTQFFGTENANAEIFINEVGTGAPAVIMSDTTGGVVNTFGETVTNSEGLLSVYIDTEKTWVITKRYGGTLAITGPTIASSSGILTLSTKLASLHNFRVLECVGNLVLTIGDNLPRSFSAVIIPNATVTIQGEEGILLNGDTAPIVRNALETPMFAIQGRPSSSKSFLVTE